MIFDGAGYIMMTTHPKPWSVADFERERPHMTDWVRSNVIPHLEDTHVRRVLIRAPVKSGKREIVEYIAMRDNVLPRMRSHAFVSAFHRVADDLQRIELKDHNTEVVSVTNDEAIHKFKSWLKQQLDSGRQVIVHLDECDYGSGIRQKMRAIWEMVRVDIRCTVLMYSATPEEVLFSDEVLEEGQDETSLVGTIFKEGVVLQYTPPVGYCGPARFLEEGLVKKAEPFFIRTSSGWALSSQGLEIINGMRESHSVDHRRNFLVLRLSYGEIGGTTTGKQKKAFYQFLQNLPSLPELMASDIMIHIDKDTFKPLSESDIPASIRTRVNCKQIEWSNPTFWRMYNTEDLHIIVVDQTSTRSTEWACHNRLYAYHDYRNTVSFSTVSQAQERVNHYEQRYGGFQKIKVYGHIRSFQLSAGLITYDQYLTYDWEKRKVDVRTANSSESVYKIRSSITGTIHPEYPSPLNEKDANAILEKLDCLADISLSTRVKGSTFHVPVYKTEFHTVSGTDDSAFSAFVSTHLSTRWPDMTFDNPFTESINRGLSPEGKYKGYLRRWAVLDYDLDIVPQPGWGLGEGTRPRLTICYNGSELGIAIRYFNKEYRKENTLRAFRSMYHSVS